MGKAVAVAGRGQARAGGQAQAGGRNGLDWGQLRGSLKEALWLAAP